jgi:hypothetical protein
MVLMMMTLIICYSNDDVDGEGGDDDIDVRHYIDDDDVSNNGLKLSYTMTVIVFSP